MIDMHDQAPSRIAATSAVMDKLPVLSGPELVFGLVGAVGSDLKAVTRTLTSELERVRYKVEEIHVSSLLHQLDRYPHLSLGRSKEQLL